MDFGSINPILLIASLMVASTPILLAALGEMVVEKAGVLNLGVEGMMITGAVVGFAIGVNTGSSWAGFAVAALAGAALSMIFAIITQVLLSNQVATGLGLTLFGLGLSSLIGKPYVGMKAPGFAKLHIPGLSEIPFVGPVLFRHDPMVYVSILIVAGVWYLLTFTRAGLILRAVGENHNAAHALGYKVKTVRFAAIAFGGSLIGFCLPLASAITNSWSAEAPSKIPICLPSRITRIRSLRARTSGRSEEIQMMAIPSFANSLII